MKLTNVEKQRAFKARMLERGSYRVNVWIPRDATRRITPDIFFKELEELCEGFSKTQRSALFEKLLAFAQSELNKEAKRQR
jgi:hypothetical protein